jgi:hypothetical protein
MSETPETEETEPSNSAARPEMWNHWGLECRRCGHVRHLYPSHNRNTFEKFLAEVIGLGPYRCHACQWRGLFPTGVSRVVKRHLRRRQSRRVLFAIGTVLFLLVLIEIIILVPEIGGRVIPAKPFGDP